MRIASFALSGLVVAGHSSLIPHLSSLSPDTLQSLSDCCALRTGLPSAIFSPWSSTAIRSEIPITTGMWCSMRKHGDAAFADLVDQLHQVGVSAGFIPAAGSSSRSNCGLHGQGAGDFKPALMAVGEVLGELMGLLFESGRTAAPPGPGARLRGVRARRTAAAARRARTATAAACPSPTARCPERSSD